MSNGDGEIDPALVATMADIIRIDGKNFDEVVEENDHGAIEQVYDMNELRRLVESKVKMYFNVLYRITAP